MTLTLDTKVFPGNKLNRTGLNLDLRWLVDAIVAEDVAAKTYLNHGENRDPAWAWGSTGALVSVSNYYQPSNAFERNNQGTIGGAASLSGRRRLFSRIENAKVSFFTANHPQEAANLRTNGYGSASWIDMAN